MYVTRPLSLYRKSPDSLFEAPPEGPNSGFLVIRDEESIQPTCFGLCKSGSIDDLPLPSNNILKVDYNSNDDHEILAIPVIDQPLSANQYYAIKAHGRRKGEAYVCSKEEDTGVCCGGTYIRDAKPRPLDPKDIYQQFKFSTTITCNNSNAFLAKSIAPDGHPPKFLRSKELHIHTSTRTSKNFIQGGEATGLNSSLRANLPNFNFPLSREFSEPICIGTWYVPFMFIHEGKLQDQVKKSVYYELRLEQYWERIFTCESSYVQGNKVMMDVVVPTEVVAIGGKDAVRDGRSVNDKVVSFKTIGSAREELSVGISSLITERMIWEQERFGWVMNGKEKQVRVVREEEYGGIGWWVRFGCYVLVERYVLKRRDGTLVLTYDFKHTHHIKTNWE